MINEKQILTVSKFLSLVLRHNPDKIGIKLDQNGWTDVNELIEKTNSYGMRIDRAILNFIVDTNSKKRFAFNNTLDKIRASQGHSLQIDLDYTSQQPPKILYHGTGQQSVDSILKIGIEKRNRQHVHLSADLETAIKVGQRHGKPFVFQVLAQDMHEDGFVFFVSDNNVWLTDNVPAKYLLVKRK